MYLYNMIEIFILTTINEINKKNHEIMWRIRLDRYLKFILSRYTIDRSRIKMIVFL